MPFYAVASGRQTGIFTDWDTVQPLVSGYAGARFKKFKLEAEAKSFCMQRKEICISAREVTSLKRRHLDESSQPDSKKEKSEPAIRVLSASAPQGPHKDTDLVAFCDGSSLNNGSKNAKAGYACIFPYNESWNVSTALPKGGTNNRAEFSAALEAMKRANIQDPVGKEPLYIYSDSQLLIDSMTKWLDGWIKRGWKKSDGKDVLNKDLLMQLMEMKRSRTIVWTHVKAHTGRKDWKSYWNDKVDILARQAAENSA